MSATEISALPAIDGRSGCAPRRRASGEHSPSPTSSTAGSGSAARSTCDRAARPGWSGTATDGSPCGSNGCEPERYLAIRWAGETDKTLDDSPGTLVEWTLDASDDGGTLLHLRESGFTTRKSRLEHVGGWVEELAELMDHLAVEPWEAPIRRVLHLSASRQRVWRALTDPRDFCAWWGSRTELDVAGRTEGWFDFPEHGRYAVRVEAVEPERYFAWSWSAAAKDTALADADEVLLTEWLLQARKDGGTDLHLVESGFRGPDSRTNNTRGWDGQLANLEAAVGG